MADPINRYKLCMVIDGVKKPVVAGPHALFSINQPAKLSIKRYSGTPLPRHWYSGGGVHIL